MKGKQRKVRQFLGMFLAVLMALGTCISNVPGAAYAAEEQSGKHVVIYEIYGGGGNSGAVYTNDYIVLYNPTGEAVSLEGFSVQYASSGTAGAFNGSNITALSGSIGAGKYYLIQEAAGSNTVKELPSPDAEGTIAMGGKAGEVALVKGTEAISGVSDTNIVDFAGYGAAKQYEGTAPAGATTNATAVARDTKGTDTDDNKADFTVGTPNPKNSKSSSGISADTQVGNVTVTPDSSDVVLGRELTLSCETEEAVVYYTVNGGVQQKYNAAARPQLTDLPATVVVWAEKDGLKPSEKNTYQYTQKAVTAVSATPSGSSVEIGTQVALACATQEAVISYSMDNGVTWKNYSEAITLESLPCTIQARATADGYADSLVSTFDYKQKTQDTEHTGDYNIYFGQLHSHTNLSDGAGTVAQAFEHASKVANLDFLAVTDHSNSFEGNEYTNTLTTSAMDNAKWSEGKNAASAITASKIANTDNVTDSSSTFLGVYGFEMTWSDGSGHINTFNTLGFENRNNPVYDNKSQSASNPSGLQAYYAKLVEAQGSISQFNHPGTTFGDFYDFTNYSAENDARLNLIEVGNGEGAVGSSGYFPSYSYYTRALDKGWHVAPTNNQDNHKGNWGDANTTRSVILADELTEESLYDALSNRRVYATEDSDLSIQYTLNGAVMGSILSEKTENAVIEAKLSDPTDESIGTVEVIVNGGKVAAAKTVSEKEAIITFDLKDDYAYYYLRVTQTDGNIAVTAPVWTGEVEKAGIASVETETALPINGEELTITTSLYNNEAVDMTVEEISYSVDEKVIYTVKGENLEGGAVVGSLGEKSFEFAYTPDRNGEVTVTALMKALLDGVEHTYSVPLTLTVSDPKTVTKVVIDGTHLNDYVNGYYKGNMTNFIDICAAQGIQAVIETENITAEQLAEADLFVVTAPLKYDKSGELAPTSFSEDFMKLTADYVQNGGRAILCGTADYQDSTAGDPYTTSTQINDLLAAMGAKTTINSDEVYDADNNDGQPYRLKLTNVNTESEWLSGVVSEQRYSVYSGCTVNPATENDWLVKGHETTYSINSKVTDSKYESSVEKNGTVIEAGNACVLATEQVGEGRIFVSGTIFLSNFEVKASMDSYSDLQYTNYTIINNILSSVKRDIPVSTIGEVRKNGQTGDIYAIEGTVTAGSEGENAFFDTIYVQDATGGIDVFPVANGSGIKIGQKIRVVGHVDYYQGDKELKIGSGVEGYTVLDESIQEITPEILSAKEAMDYDANGGKLVQVKGTVSDIVKVNGILSSFLLDDGSGVKAKVYFNGNVAAGVDESIVAEGNVLSATGLVYMDPEGTCLRVRNGQEIVAVSDKNGWFEEDGAMYWYENGVKQGLEGRGKEIYDAASDAWYWLDALEGGKMAAGKDVYLESDGGKWVRYDEEGRMVKGEACKDGAWYRFDETSGAMAKGWYCVEQNGKTDSYYYDVTTGIMVHGAVSIDEEPYAFDDITGIAVDCGWYPVDGKMYWYEAGKRQGLKGRGKEIYDSATDAWYFLDAVNGGQKAAGKDVYLESDGGKWVRYDADGQMVKGWNHWNGSSYYFDAVTGVMAKGSIVIDGMAYYFNEVTGVLQ